MWVQSGTGVATLLMLSIIFSSAGSASTLVHLPAAPPRLPAFLWGPKLGSREQNVSVNVLRELVTVPDPKMQGYCWRRRVEVGGKTVMKGTERQQSADGKRSITKKSMSNSRHGLVKTDRDEMWKEKTLLELTEEWPLGLAASQTASQREREQERSWVWQRFLFWQVKIHKKAVVYVKMAKILALYFGFSLTFPAIHVVSLVVAFCAAFQFLLEREYERKMSKEERLLVHTLPFLDEDDDPFEYGYYD